MTIGGDGCKGLHTWNKVSTEIKLIVEYTISIG